MAPTSGMVAPPPFMREAPPLGRRPVEARLQPLIIPDQACPAPSSASSQCIAVVISHRCCSGGLATRAHWRRSASPDRRPAISSVMASGSQPSRTRAWRSARILRHAGSAARSCSSAGSSSILNSWGRWWWWTISFHGPERIMRWYQPSSTQNSENATSSHASASGRGIDGAGTEALSAPTMPSRLRPGDTGSAGAPAASMMVAVTSSALTTRGHRPPPGITPGQLMISGTRTDASWKVCFHHRPCSPACSP